MFYKCLLILAVIFNSLLFYCTSIFSIGHAAFSIIMNCAFGEAVSFCGQEQSYVRQSSHRPKNLSRKASIISDRQKQLATIRGFYSCNKSMLTTQSSFHISRAKFDHNKIALPVQRIILDFHKRPIKPLRMNSRSKVEMPRSKVSLIEKMDIPRSKINLNRRISQEIEKERESVPFTVRSLLDGSVEELQLNSLIGNQRNNPIKRNLVDSLINKK